MMGLSITKKIGTDLAKEVGMLLAYIYIYTLYHYVYIYIYTYSVFVVVVAVVVVVVVVAVVVGKSLCLRTWLYRRYLRCRMLLELAAGCRAAITCQTGHGCKPLDSGMPSFRPAFYSNRSESSPPECYREPESPADGAGFSDYSSGTHFVSKKHFLTWTQAESQGLPQFGIETLLNSSTQALQKRSDITFVPEDFDPSTNFVTWWVCQGMPIAIVDACSSSSPLTGHLPSNHV